MKVNRQNYRQDRTLIAKMQTYQNISLCYKMQFKSGEEKYNFIKVFIVKFSSNCEVDGWKKAA